MPVYSDFVKSLMDLLKVQQAVLAGNSLGGYVAWKTAVDYPDRVSKLILVDAAGYATNAASVPIGFKLAQIPMLSGLMSNILPRRVVESSLRNVYGDPSKITTELVDRYYELALRAGNRKSLAARFAQNKPGEFESQIPQIKQPTLILWGGLDRLIPPENAQKISPRYCEQQHRHVRHPGPCGARRRPCGHGCGGAGVSGSLTKSMDFCKL